MSKQVEQALTYFDNKMNCAQAVLAAFCEPLGLDKETACKISCGFGAGMAHLGLTCGAVSGAVMVIGLNHYNEADKATKPETLKLVREFDARFRERNGSTNCPELLGIAAQDYDSYTSGRATGRCRKMVQDAAEILEEIL